VYKAQRPGCTHAYAVNGHAVAQTLLDEIGHDLVMAVDLAMAHLANNSTSGVVAYVMLPPPITQLSRTDGRKRVRSAHPKLLLCVHGHGVEGVLTKRLGIRTRDCISL
jgi:hypothetical protein